MLINNLTSIAPTDLSSKIFNSAHLNLILWLVISCNLQELVVLIY